MGVAGAWFQYIIIAMLHSVQRIVEAHVLIQAPPTVGGGGGEGGTVIKVISC